MNSFSIKIASLPDREKVVAEIWRNGEFIAEINQENEDLAVEIYIDEKSVTLPVDEFIAALSEAKSKLSGGLPL